MLYGAFVSEKGVEDSTLPAGSLYVHKEDTDMRPLATTFVDAGSRAQEAIDADFDDKCKSAKVFRNILARPSIPPEDAQS